MQSLKNYSAHALSFSVGMLSMGQEILWVRLYGFALSGTPRAFAFVLAAYLVGISLGALIGKYVTLRFDNLLAVSGFVLISAGLFDLYSPILLSRLATDTVAAWSIIMLSAMLKAIIFPITHHLGTVGTRGMVGRSLSKVYLANIAGSTLGPLLFGFVLIGSIGTEYSFDVVAIATLTVAGLCLWYGCISKLRIGLICAGVVLASGPIYSHGDLLRDATGFLNPVRQIIETRQGIITTYRVGVAEDAVFGGNVYDGTTNLNPTINSNGIDRVLVLAALHPEPKRVLMIGLSIGSWLRLVTGFDGVEQIDVVEINPGYVDAIQSYPPQAAALRDPRVTLHIGDGRKWLRSHPDRKYDLVIMNATNHWRAYASNLLSVEFLRLIKAHMFPGGLLAYNGTESPDALYTADSVFSNAYSYRNFIIAGETDFRNKLVTPQSRRRLQAIQFNGIEYFRERDERAVERILEQPFTALDDIVQRHTRSLEIISDRNLITEYKFGKKN
jgi:spermidine synthase